MSLEMKNKISHRKKIVVTFLICATSFFMLIGRLTYLMIWKSDYYTEKATQLHERERPIKAARGRLLDRYGKVLADNKTVCTISVIHSQIEDEEKVIAFLCDKLELTDEYVRKRVEKISSMEKIRSNVPKEIGDAIREADIAGIKVDEDYKRYYPYDDLASKVLGFTGADNQGIIGLEVIYDEYLSGQEGKVLTVTDAKGVELEDVGEHRLEPVAGNDLILSLDANIQSYAYQLAKQVQASKEADRVSFLVMSPQNGEIYAMVDVPEFHLNDPYTITAEYQELWDKEQARLKPKEEQVTNDTADWQNAENSELQETAEKEPKKTPEQIQQEMLNGMWRNGCINDTYEPGSTFKVVTAAAALESKTVTVDDNFFCPGYVIVEDRRIRCHKIAGHGSETFVQATMNSCNPVFVTVGLRVGAKSYYSYLNQFGLLEKNGIDLPGEAGTIMHPLENIGEVELATMAFGQSFQITPLQLATTVSSLVNGGNRVTPHLGLQVQSPEGKVLKSFSYPIKKQIVSKETSETLQMILEQVVENGSGKNGYVEGFRIGGKTATSQTLPRGSGRYIASFVGFWPADNPQVLALLVIHNPQGTYYGGQIAAPVVKQLFENILPYLQDKGYNK